MKMLLRTGQWPSAFLISFLWFMGGACLLSFPVGAQEHPGLFYMEPVRQASPADSARIISLINKGAAHGRRNSDSALYYFMQAKASSVSSGFILGHIRSLHSLGTYYLEKGAADKAKTFYLRSLKHCPVKDPAYQSERAVIYNNLGSVYLYGGNYDTAAGYFYQAARLGEHYKASAEILLSIYNNLASVMNKLQEREQSLWYLNKAVAVADSAKSPYLLNIQLHNKAQALRIYDQTDSALFYFGRSLDLSRRHGFHKIELATLLNLGNTVPGAAQRRFYLQQAVRLLEEQPDNFHQQELATSFELAKAYYELKDYNRAEQLALQTWENALQSRSLEVVMLTQGLRAEIYAATGRPDQAYRTQKTFSELKDSLLDIKKIEAISLLETKYAAAQREKEIAEKQLFIRQQESQIRGKNRLIYAIAAGLIGLCVIFFSIYQANRRRAKAKQQQQEIDQLKAVMEGEERERNRLARELHDGIGGMLASIRMNLSVVRYEYPPFADTRRLDELMYLVQDTAAEVRKTAHNLMPDVLTRHSLVDALVMYCEQLNQRKGPEIALQFRGNLDKLGKPSELILYRIIQELLQNIIKHARAAHAHIQLIEEQDKVMLFVEDDGRGFETDNAVGGYGLQNLRYRVQALKGEVAIMSEPGRGTTIHITFEKKEAQEILSI